MIQSSQPIEAKSINRESRQHSLEPGPQFRLLLWRLIVRCGKVSITMKGFRSLCVEMGRLLELHVSQATWIVCDKSWWSTQFLTGHAISVRRRYKLPLGTCFRTCLFFNAHLFFPTPRPSDRFRVSQSAWLLWSSNWTPNDRFPIEETFASFHNPSCL